MENFTFDDLQEAIENDTSNSRIKELAELFLTAMIEWPTFDQTSIDKFVRQLKSYYGDPLTLAKIDSKEWDSHNEEDVWRHTASSSIAEMIDISSRFEKESQFSKILNRLFNYCKNEKPVPNNAQPPA